MTSALAFYKTNFLCYFFLICILNTCFFTNKINFGNLGNFVTVGDTFISWLTIKVKF
jgi:hypothetical protein